MKFVKGLIVVFILSIVCVKTGVSAWTYTVYSHALKALGGNTEQAQLYKSTNDSQVLQIDNVYKDRNIKFRISHLLNSGSWNPSTWQKVSVSGSYPIVLEIDGGMIQELIAIYNGTKKLEMKTSGIHIGVTSVRGVWWVSMADYFEYLSVA